METTIVSLSMREITDRELRDVLSEPIELIREFKEDDEFEKLIRDVDRNNTYNIKRQGQAAVKETYYLSIIKGHANIISPLLELSGKKTEVTP